MLNRSLSDKPIQGEKYFDALVEAFRLQECILNTIDLAIVSMTPEGVITSFNPSSENLLGYSSEEVVGKLSPLVFHIEEELRNRAQIISNEGKVVSHDFNVLSLKAKNQKGPDRNNWTIIRKDGTRFPASVTVVGVRDEQGVLVGFVEIISDITLQKDGEEKLQKFAEENVQFFNNPVNLNAITDFDGTLQRISPSWTKLLGWSEDELKSKPFLSFIHPQDVPAATNFFQDLISGKRIATFENRVQTKDGHYIWLLWSAASDSREKIIYASAIDITERKKSEENILDSKTNLETLAEQLKEQNRQLDEFAHIISHNLRAPVNNIQALITLLNNNSHIEDYKLIFEKLKNVAKNLSETMNELMDTLKVKTGPDIDRSEIRFKEILDKVVQSLEGELIVAGASVTFDFNNAPTIQYSKPYIESIFQNLLTNAIKYRSPNRKPTIHFQSAIVNDWIELKVADNGQGIDMNLFGDKLFGLHKTFHDHDEARGVGLFLIKTQIEAMGGKITAESEVDKGTTFIITFVK